MRRSLVMCVSAAAAGVAAASNQAAGAFVLDRTGQVDLFATFDADADGVVSSSEFFVLGRDMHQNKSQEFMQKLFDVEDVNRDGVLQFSEFTGPKHYALFPDIFAALDRDDDGWLTPQEYVAILPEAKQQYRGRAAMGRCDSNDDNLLSLAEFTVCKVKVHDVKYAEMHTFRVAKFAAFMDSVRDYGGPANATYLAEINAAMRGAARMLEAGALSFTTHPNFALSFTVGDRVVMVPLVFHLMELYTQLKLHSIRHLLLLCLRAGANPTAQSPWTVYRAPALLTTLWKSPTDTELIAELIRAGHDLGGIGTGRSGGWSLFHIFFHSTEVNIVKKLFVVADQFAISDELDHQRKSVADIFRDVADSGISRGDWQGDLFRIDYTSLLHTSPTFASLVDDWNSNGPTDFIDRGVSHAINEEASLANLRLLLDGGLDITEMAMQQPTDGWNVLHLLAHLHYERCIKMLFNEVNLQSQFERGSSKPQTPARRAEILRAAHWALRQTDNTVKRTPVHMAAAFFRDSSVLRVLTEARRMVDDLMRQHGIPLSGRVAPHESQDVLGNLPAAYVDGSATWHIPVDKMPPDFFDKAISHNVVGGESAINQFHELREAKGDNQTQPVDDGIGGSGGAAAVDAAPPPSAATDGGWGEFFGVRSDLQSNTPDRCDIKELTTMPSKAEWAELVMAGEPFVVRNGAEQLGVRRHLWERENFLALYGDQQVRVGKIPYQRSFASYVPRGPEFQHSPMDGLVTMRDFVSSFHVHGGADDTGIPNYLFNTKFTSDNPSLMESCAEAFDFAMDVAGINLVFEGQFYLGPPASGAPAHWHSGAINVMAYGKKRWALFPPHQGSFYSIKPSVDFFKWDLPEMEALGKVLHFTQHSGDILCLPKNWGHATLNIETSIGIAFEVSHGPTHPRSLGPEHFQTVVQIMERHTGQPYFASFDAFDVNQVEEDYPGWLAGTVASQFPNWTPPTKAAST